MTNARFAPLLGLSVGPFSLSTTPAPLRKPRARHERQSPHASKAAGFRLRLGSGVALRLRSARRSSPSSAPLPRSPTADRSHSRQSSIITSAHLRIEALRARNSRDKTTPSQPQSGAALSVRSRAALTLPSLALNSRRPLSAPSQSTNGQYDRSNQPARPQNPSLLHPLKIREHSQTEMPAETCKHDTARYCRDQRVLCSAPRAAGRPRLPPRQHPFRSAKLAFVANSIWNASASASIWSLASVLRLRGFTHFVPPAAPAASRRQLQTEARLHLPVNTASWRKSICRAGSSRSESFSVIATNSCRTHSTGG